MSTRALNSDFRMTHALRWFKLSKRFSSTLNAEKDSISWSYKHQLDDQPLLPFTIGKLLEISAKKYPNTVAVISKYDNKSTTFSQLLRTADKLAAAFRKFGLKPGDRVGIWSPNCTEWETAMLACARTGLIAVHLNPGYMTKEMLFCINKVGIKCMVCPAETEKHNFYEILNEIDSCVSEGVVGKRMPSLDKVVVIGDKTPRGTLNFEEIQEGITEKEIAAVGEYQDRISMDTGSNIMFTSGSTGYPKAALLSHFNLVNNSYNTGKRLAYDSKHHKILVQVPFFHTFGTTAGILGAMHFGSTLVLPSLYYQPEENLKALESEKCSVIYGTPTMYVDLINGQKAKKLQLQAEIAAVGGAPTNPKLIQDMYNILGVKNAMNFYGMTETTAIIFQSFLKDSCDDVANTVGHVGAHVEVKVIDEHGNTVPCGTPGELCTRGYLTMLNYYDEDDKTRSMIGQDKWLKTGDKFVLYENGYGKIVGRLKDIIIRGGENVYPKEIEDFLSAHPKVIECQVVGIPHERLGEEVCLCVRVSPGETITLQEVKDYCHKEIARYKIPSKLFVMKDFPKTTSGKIQKFKIVENILKKEDVEN